MTSQVTARPESHATAPEAAIAAVIVNHNTREDLRTCLASIAEREMSQVIVVDTASTDGSAEMVRDEFPGATLLLLAGNPGYGAAANRGIAACETRHVLLLNSDTRLQPGSLAALAGYLDTHPRAAMAGPRLLNPDGTLQPSCFPFPTPFQTFLRESFLNRLLRRIPALRSHYLPAWSHNEVRDVPWVLGAVLAIRREAFLAVGGFDESFFMYFEEVDLCYRLHAAGWEVHFTPVTLVVHTGGQSTRHYRVGMAVQLYTSLRQFYRQHYTNKQVKALELVITYIMLRNTVRDTIRMRRSRDLQERNLLADDLSAWRSVITHARGDTV